MRFNPDGSVDRVFGADGFAVVPSLISAQAIAVQADSKLVVGSAVSPPQIGPHLAALERRDSLRVGRGFFRVGYGVVHRA